jgi:hypothetical protein
MIRCDRCGRAIPAGGPRYVVRIEVRASSEPLEIDAADLARDRAAEMAAVQRDLERMSAAEAEDGVYRLFCFDLCRPCQIEYLRDPLPAGGRDARSMET